MIKLPSSFRARTGDRVQSIQRSVPFFPKFICMASGAPGGLPAVVLAGDPVLRRLAEPVPHGMFGTKARVDRCTALALPSLFVHSPRLCVQALEELIETMIAVMRAAPGVGLAAPQIGVGLQVMVLEDKEEYIQVGLPLSRSMPPNRLTLALPLEPEHRGPRPSWQGNREGSPLDPLQSATRRSPPWDAREPGGYTAFVHARQKEQG